jgi:hypothetical protein
LGGQSIRFKESENLKTQRRIWGGSGVFKKWKNQITPRRIRGIQTMEKPDNFEKDQGYLKMGTKID